MNGYLKDSNGNKSSKRLWGTVCLVVGLTLAVSITAIYMIMAINKVSMDLTELSTIFYVVFGAGTTLLGTGVFEKKNGKA
jgi:hypothetical protein